MAKNQISTRAEKTAVKTLPLKSVLSYKKPAFWIVAVAIITGIAIAIYFLLNPPLTQIKAVDNFHKGFTEYEGVYIKLTGIETLNGYRRFYVAWHNETDEEIIFDESYVIESRENGKWVDANLEDNVFPEISHVLRPNTTEKLLYTSQGFDMFRSNRYRLRVTFSTQSSETYSAWIELTVGGIESLDDLRESYPQFFNLPTKNGLAVYIWQLSSDDYRCYLAPMQKNNTIDSSLTFNEGASISDMRRILTAYNIRKEDVTIFPIKHPLSDYEYEINERYTSILTYDFWVKLPRSVYGSPIIDLAAFDIDKDGEDEICRIEDGPLSGLFSITFTATEAGADYPSYVQTFGSPSGSYSFRKCDDGVMRVQCVSDDTPSMIYLFDIGTSENSVVLKKYGEYIAEE